MIHQLSDPTEKDGQYSVLCSCGFTTTPAAAPEQAVRQAITHITTVSRDPNDV